MINTLDKRKYIPLILSVIFAVFVGRLDANIVIVSLPTIADYFKTSVNSVSWIVLSFNLVLTSTLMLFGFIIDRIGVKKIFIVGYIVFTASSLVCGLSPTFTVLIVARIVQALGAAILVTGGFVIISKFIPQSISGWAYGLLTATQALAVAAGTGLGGLISGLASWHWIFLINIPIGFVGIVVAKKVIPNDEEIFANVSGKSFDFIGFALSFLTISLLSYTLYKVPEDGWFSIRTLSLFFLVLIALVVFVLQEKKCKNPLLNLKIFENRKLCFASITFFVFMLTSGFALLTPFYLEIVKGFSPQLTGLTFTLYSIVYIASSYIAGKASDKINPYIFCRAALALEVATMLFFAFTFSYHGYLYLTSFLLFFAIANGFFFSPNNKIIMSFAIEHTKGIVSGFLNLLIGVGSILGISIFEAVYTSSLHVSTYQAFKNIGLLSAAVFCFALIFNLTIYKIYDHIKKA
jgi:EmrB/QacA subfamily drug resistance transporter